MKNNIPIVLFIFFSSLSFGQNSDECYNSSARIAMDFFKAKDIENAKLAMEDVAELCTPGSKPTSYFLMVKKKIYGISSSVVNSNKSVITETINGVSFNMKLVEGGSFNMGSNDGDKDEKPIHTVEVATFYIGETEVTHEQYIVFLNDKGVNSSGSYGGEKYVRMDFSDCAIGYNRGRFYFKGSTVAKTIKTPMIVVTWYGAKAYCKWISGKTGKKYRLPTEAEWEYASRGGKKSNGYTYSGSNNIEEVAWYKKNSFDKGKNHKDYGTHAVKQKKSNEIGLYDMSGNVCEWCEDAPHDNYQGAPKDGKAWISGSSSSDPCRIFRGSSWGGNSKGCRSANRSFNPICYTTEHYGFRLALQY